MVLSIKITDNEWTRLKSIGENVLENKNIFINYLINLFIVDVKNIDSCEDVNIVLPVTVTKAERHQIHKMTSYEFNPNSYDNTEGERYMVIALHKRLIVEWINSTGYQFPPEHLPVEEEFEVDPVFEIVVEDNNQQEFNVLMNIIFAHYPEELNKWKLTQM
jgi:hypothetical protein